MISLFLAAVIAQPLDSVYQSAAHGVTVSVSASSAWRECHLPFPYAIKAIGTADGSLAVVIHIQELAVSERNNDFPLRGVGENYIPGHCRVLRAGQLENAIVPTRMVEYVGLDGDTAVRGQIFVRFSEGVLVGIQIMCSGPTQEIADSRFAAASRTFAEVLSGWSVSPAGKPDASAMNHDAPSGAWAMIALACLAGVAVVWMVVRHRPSSLKRSR